MSDRVADRVAKLLRIAARDPGPQGKTAARIAREIQKKHGLDVRLPETCDSADSIVFVVSQRSVAWRSKILDGVAETYGLETRITSTKQKKGRSFSVWLMGDPQALGLARCHYEFLAGSIEHLTASYESGLHNKERLWSRRFDACSFAEGAASAVCDKMTQKRRRDPDQKVDVVAVHHDPRRPVPATSQRVVWVRPEYDPTPRIGGEDVSIDAGRSTYWARGGYRMGKDFINPRPYPVVFGKLEALGLSRQILDVLHGAGLDHVADLLRITPRELSSIPGIGKARRGTIAQALRRWGCALRPVSSRVS
jgi:hypothetical protein